MAERPLKIVFITPALYMAGGVERVLTLKANYFAEHFGYDVTIILSEGKDKPPFYPLSDKIKVVNLDINFEELVCQENRCLPTKAAEISEAADRGTDAHSSGHHRFFASAGD